MTAQEKYTALLQELSFELDFSLQRAQAPRRTIRDHEEITVRLRHAAALAQELENLAKGL